MSTGVAGGGRRFQFQGVLAGIALGEVEGALLVTVLVPACAFAGRAPEAALFNRNYLQAIGDRFVIFDDGRHALFSAALSGLIGSTPHRDHLKAPARLRGHGVGELADLA